MEYSNYKIWAKFTPGGKVIPIYGIIKSQLRREDISRVIHLERDLLSFRIRCFFFRIFSIEIFSKFIGVAIRFHYTVVTFNSWTDARQISAAHNSFLLFGK